MIIQKKKDIKNTKTNNTSATTTEPLGGTWSWTGESLTLSERESVYLCLRERERASVSVKRDLGSHTQRFSLRGRDTPCLYLSLSSWDRWQQESLSQIQRFALFQRQGPLAWPAPSIQETETNTLSQTLSLCIWERVSVSESVSMPVVSVSLRERESLYLRERLCFGRRDRDSPVQDQVPPSGSVVFLFFIVLQCSLCLTTVACVCVHANKKKTDLHPPSCTASHSQSHRHSFSQRQTLSASQMIYIISLTNTETLPLPET